VVVWHTNPKRKRREGATTMITRCWAMKKTRVKKNYKLRKGLATASGLVRMNETEAEKRPKNASSPARRKAEWRLSAEKQQFPPTDNHNRRSARE